jgi:hypothetical protein
MYERTQWGLALATGIVGFDASDDEFYSPTVNIR